FTADHRAAPGRAALRLANASPGTLDGLELRAIERRPPGPGEVEIEVRAVGLNFKDVLNALGLYPGDPGRLATEGRGGGGGAVHRGEDGSAWPGTRRRGGGGCCRQLRDARHDARGPRGAQ